jgi:5-methylcytosine-specific restriction protein A
MKFEQGKKYIRRELHEQFGGQQQGGISTPANHPIIFLFTGKQGEEYGYKDGWTDDNLFLYTGEGQQGDMEFLRGNRAIRDHAKNGKELHLFKYIGRGTVEYISQMLFEDYEYRDAPDVTGNMRKAIVFHLAPIDSL